MCCVALPCLLVDLACFFLPSHLSFKNMYMLTCGHGEITEAVKLCMYMLTCGHGEITEAMHVHADVWSWRNY